MENRKPHGKLYGRKVALIATDGFEESELVEPLHALREAGAFVDIISDHPGEIQGFRHLEPGLRVRVDKVIGEVDPDSYDALHLPGGTINADTLRVNKEVLDFIRNFADYNKPISAICHAPWILINSGFVRGRTLTSYHSISTDLRNAGAAWVDEPVVVHGNLTTSRQPSDLAVFNQTMLERFTKSVIERAA